MLRTAVGGILFHAHTPKEQTKPNIIIQHCQLPIARIQIPISKANPEEIPEHRTIKMRRSPTRDFSRSPAAHSEPRPQQKSH
jgi:hypothetical protein